MKNGTNSRLQLNIQYLKRLAMLFGYKFENENSKMFICGRISSKIIEFQKEFVTFLRFMVECERESGALDTVQVVIRADNAQSLKTAPARTQITILGSLVSEDWCEPDGTHHLDIYMLAGHYEFGEVGVEEQFDRNIVVLDGHICIEPSLKVTDRYRRDIAEVRLAVNNDRDVPYCFPLIVWGKRARQVYQFNKKGDHLKLTGRIQSREFVKDGKAGMAFEVSTTYTEHMKRVKK